MMCAKILKDRKAVVKHYFSYSTNDCDVRKILKDRQAVVKHYFIAFLKGILRALRESMNHQICHMSVLTTILRHLVEKSTENGPVGARATRPHFRDITSAMLQSHGL